MCASVGSARGGVGTHCTAPRWAMEWRGKGTVQPPPGEATIMLSSCSTVQRTPALPQSLRGHCGTSGDASRTRTVPRSTCAVTSCAPGTVWQTAKVRGLGATPKVRHPGAHGCVPRQRHCSQPTPYLQGRLDSAQPVRGCSPVTTAEPGAGTMASAPARRSAASVAVTTSACPRPQVPDTGRGDPQLTGL